MITVLGIPIQLPASWSSMASPYTSFVLTILAWVLIALLLYLVFRVLLHIVARGIPGDIEEVIINIVRRPAVLLIAVGGAVNSLELLPLNTDTVKLLQRIFVTVLILSIVYLLWHIIKDILVYYGDSWARRTESRVDDVIIPILNLFGPLAIVITATLIILPLWGINITSVLVGAGILGLVLGLALQDTLSNLFSGLSLLVEAPFRTGDLIVLSDGKMCEVKRIGIRSTELYSLDEHSTVYMPNKILVTTALVNTTKPTFEQKVSITVNIPSSANMVQAQECLKRIAAAHPNVLVAELEGKIPLIRERVAQTCQTVDPLPADDLVRLQLLDEAAHYEWAIEKLEMEAGFNGELLALLAALQELKKGLEGREAGGFTRAEMQDLHTKYFEAVEAYARDTVAHGTEWSAIPDPWASPQEARAERTLWQERNERLSTRLADLKRDLARPWTTEETRLDDIVDALICWISEEYKLLPEPWKNPHVTFKGFEGDSIALQLWFFIDNIRLEHYGRTRRVITEIARHIREGIQGSKCFAGAK